MKIHLCSEKVSNLKADGLVLPVDGNICVIGGTAAAKALKESFAFETESREEQMEMYEYSEDDVKALHPLLHGKAKVILGNDTWQYLVVIAVQPHHVDDQIFSKEQFCQILQTGVVNAINESIRNGLKSMALTLISNSYRISSNMSVSSIAEALNLCRQEEVDVYWSIIDEKNMELAEKMCGYLELPMQK